MPDQVRRAVDIKNSERLFNRGNLFIKVEGDTTFVLPKRWYDEWDPNHSFAVKRAGSVIVIKDGKVEKNLFKEEPKSVEP